MIRLLALVVISAATYEVAAAWGVSEKSVKKWDDEKLCKQLAKLEIKKDAEAVAIVANEISRRPDLDSTECTSVRASQEQEIQARTLETRTAPLDDYVEKVIDKVELLAKTKHEQKQRQNMFDSICKKEPWDVKLLEDYVAYAVSEMPPREARYSALVANRIKSKAYGFAQAASMLKIVDPNICSEASRERLRAVLEAYFAQPALLM